MKIAIVYVVDCVFTELVTEQPVFQRDTSKFSLEYEPSFITAS